jgi:hypothetical protein
MKEIRVLAERWRVHYNTIRPHSSLGYRPPAPEARLVKNLGHAMTPVLRLQGWIAISETHYWEQRLQYMWIDQYPFERVGRSIRLYHLTNPPH